MEVGAQAALLSLAVALLLCCRVGCTPGGRSGAGSCDLSIFRTLSPAVMKNFLNFRNHYMRSHSLLDSDPLLASLDELKALSVPERRVLVRGEFELYAEVLRNVTERSPGAVGRRVRDTLCFITVKLTECVMDNNLNTDQYSKDLSRLLKGLKEAMERDNPRTLAEKVISDLIQLLNEHLTCAAKGPSC